MAENSTIAFGRYLKMLRGRRKLSLQEVASLSDSFPDPISKGYLSRCENGHQKIALNKVIPLSRIYEVPSDVIVERLELDMEVDRLGAPDTEGRSFEWLRDEAKRHLDEGRGITSYALFRDSLMIAHSSPVLAPFHDPGEQFMATLLNCASCAKTSGCLSYAQHELLFALKHGQLAESTHALVLDRLGQVYLLKNEIDLARRHVDVAIEKARSLGSFPQLSYLYGSRTLIAEAECDWELCLQCAQSGHDAAKQQGNLPEEVRHMNAIGYSYAKLERWRAAKRICLAAESMAKKHGIVRSVGHAQLVLGLVDIAEGRPTEARTRLQAARDVGKQFEHTSLRFGAELALLKLAIQLDDSSHVRAIGRRMEKLV
ncbi:MAG: helix-turn-helix domain-containing protein, partial [Acidobacteriota bacterium]|nr:helix-turn-helix domain-containing protein [Acidobacteriota bacterium]